MAAAAAGPASPLLSRRPQALAQFGDAAQHFAAGIGVAFQVGTAGDGEIDAHRLAGHEFGGGVGHFGRDGFGNGADSIGVGVQQVAGADFHAADADGLADRSDVAVGVGTDHAVAEGGETQSADLVEIARRAAGDDAPRAEAAIGGAHDFAESGADRRVVEILKNDDGGTGQFREVGHLFIEAAIDVALAAGPRGAHGGGGGVAHDGRHLGEAGADAGVHVAGTARADFEKLNNVRNGGGVVLRQEFEVGGGKGHTLQDTRVSCYV